MRFYYLLLTILLVAGLILVSYGIYHIQIGERNNGQILLGSGILALDLLTVPIFYFLWKNWYKWEFNLRPLRTIMAAILIVAIVAILIILRIIEI